MKKNEYWNDVASKGAIAGVLMLASHIFELWCTQHASLGTMAAIGFEMLAVTALYIWLLWRFAKKASLRFGDETLGFSYSNGVLYVAEVALFAGIIVGFGHYIYLHYMVGYENYTMQMVDNMQQILYQAGGNASIPAIYDTMFATMLNRPEPGIFATILSTEFSYGFWGLLIGLFIAAGVKREPKLFDNNDNGEDELI